MSEQLKYVVDHLNEKPFSKNLNLISFDSLQSLQLLQILNDVITEISPEQISDLREEDPEQRVVRMIQFLKVMKYKVTGDVKAFRTGIVQGDKPIIYPILHWLLERCGELKRRAYLARYLVKIDLPGDILMDNEVTETHTMYLELIDQFKVLHKETEQVKDSGMSAGEIKKDILSMEEEQEQLRKRIERVKKRVDPVANKDKYLAAARKLRQEQDKEAKIGEQKQQQKIQIGQIEQKMTRMQNQLKDVRAAGLGITANGLIKRLEEDNKVNSYITQDKLPKEVEARKKYYSTLQKVSDEHAMGQSELDVLNKKIKDLSSEINKLVEKRMVRNDPMDDKLAVFRQQAAVIGNKKSAAAEALKEVSDEFHQAESELNERQEQLKDTDDVEMLKGDEFKRYVNKLRGKSTIYKKKRQELSELQAEVGVLSRTEEILKSKDQHSQAFLSNLEEKHGVSGFHQTQDELEKVSTKKSELDEQKGKTLEEMSQLVVQLTNTITDKKSSLAPIIKELRPLRQQCQELTVEYGEKKGIYDTTAAGLESNMSKLEQEVKVYREEVTHEESRYHYIKAMIEILEVQQERIESEMKQYISSDNNKKSLRDQYSQKIHEQDNQGKQLREQQKYVKENHAPSMTQMKMWSDLSLLLKCKKELATRDTVPIDDGAIEHEDHLVL